MNSHGGITVASQIKSRDSFSYLVEVLFAEFSILVHIIKSEKEFDLSLSVVELRYCTRSYWPKRGQQRRKLSSKLVEYCEILKYYEISFWLMGSYIYIRLNL